MSKPLFMSKDTYIKKLEAEIATKKEELERLKRTKHIPQIVRDFSIDEIIAYLKAKAKYNLKMYEQVHFFADADTILPSEITQSENYIRKELQRFKERFKEQNILSRFFLENEGEKDGADE